MKIGKEIIKFDAPNMKEAMRVIKSLQNINFDPKFFRASLDGRGLNVSFIGKNTYADDITFESADTYVTLNATGQAADTTTWDWQTVNGQDQTVGLHLYVVVRTLLLSGIPQRLAEFKRRLTFNNLGMLERAGYEGITVVITPIMLSPTT